MKVYLYRHASAGTRSKWDGDDRLRPIDARGERQAESLVEELRGASFDHIVSSPYVRCVQSVEPLARARGLELEIDDALAEGAGADGALELFYGLGSDLLACVHGDLLEELLGESKPKGSTTVLELEPSRTP
ncbi:MAG TPA: phosphoglycerate mutase family protein [Gaiellaceae bacterium]|nr:phosphoglycerate mutase family protein [Gaiellaceae bacterium]